MLPQCLFLEKIIEDSGLGNICQKQRLHLKRLGGKWFFVKFQHPKNILPIQNHRLISHCPIVHDQLGRQCDRVVESRIFPTRIQRTPTLLLGCIGRVYILAVVG